MDEADYAQIEQERELRRLLATYTYAVPAGESASHCLDCEGEIPEARRQAMPGCIRCVSCQNMYERRR